jgi:hypothetical protein
MIRAVLLAVALLTLAGCAAQLIQHQDHGFSLKVLTIHL